ncbi:DUF4340 domain-containing protein, partial [Spirochaetota bacterium]
MKKNIILLCIVIIAAGVVFFLYRRQRMEIVMGEGEKIFFFNEDMAYKWSIHYGKTDITCEKIKNRWWITHPKRYPAGQSDVFANVKNFNTTEYIRIVSSNLDSAGKYGLVKRNAWYALYLTNEKGEEESHTLYSGNETFDKKGFYVIYSRSSNIYACEMWVVKALQKKIPDLREKDFLKVEPEDIRKVSFAGNLFTKQGYSWSYNKIAEDETDIKKIETLIHEISFMAAKEVCADSLMQGDGGLDAAEFVLLIEAVHKRSGKAYTRKLSVNKKEDIVYGMSDNDPYIYVLFP